MEYQHILLDKTDRIAKITLNMPDTKNALNMEAREELLDLLRKTAEDDSVKVVIITGKGTSFCAGGDIRTMEGLTPIGGRMRLKKGQQLVRAMVDLEKPIIASVNGVAAGAGVSLALASDVIIAAEEVKFHFSFVNIGIIPDWGEFYFLPLRIGVARAKELMLTGGPIDAREAERIGIINRLVPKEDLESEVQALAARLTRGPSQAYAMIKAALNRWPAHLDTFLELESSMQAVAFSSRDFDEGRRAFLEKRKPVFTGK